MDEYTFELVSMIVISITFVIYHAILFARILRSPTSTSAGQNNLIRQAWIKVILDERKDILAIQALRNVMMSSSLLATTSLTLSSIIAAFFIKGGDEPSKISEMGQHLSERFTVEHKLFSMIVLFTLSFFSYMQSVRINSHVGFMFGIPSDGSIIDRPDFLTLEYICKCMFRANLYHTLGTRLFYAAFLTVIWLFGHILATISSVFLLIILFFADYPIKIEKNHT